tara:strand:+ start:120 stop:416 length:297 start_codon:yes stop_codon:yes gene_type:complete
MTDKEMNKLADLIVDKLLTTYIREQSDWYSTNTFSSASDLFGENKKKKAKKPDTEDELLGELAKLLTQIEYHKQEENYERCAKLQEKVDKINKKLDEL